jgi:hypothetical protein
MVNSIEISLDIWRFAALYDRLAGASRHSKVLVRDWALLTSAAVMGARTAAAMPRLGRDEASLIVEGLVQALADAGIDRVDVATIFNRAVRTPSPTLPLGAPPIGVPSGHLLVREDALRRLAGGAEEI